MCSTHTFKRHKIIVVTIIIISIIIQSTSTFKSQQIVFYPIKSLWKLYVHNKTLHGVISLLFYQIYRKSKTKRLELFGFEKEKNRNTRAQYSLNRSEIDIQMCTITANQFLFFIFIKKYVRKRENAIVSIFSRWIEYTHSHFAPSV